MDPLGHYPSLRSRKAWEGRGEIGAAWLSEWGLGKHKIDRNETKERKRRPPTTTTLTT